MKTFFLEPLPFLFDKLKVFKNDSLYFTSISARKIMSRMVGIYSPR